MAVDGKKLIGMVKNPNKWYGKQQFDEERVAETIFKRMEKDQFHLMNLNRESISFLGGYILGYTIRENMGTRDAIETLPFEIRYVEPLRFAQIMEIHPDSLSETISSPKIKEQKLVERVQFNGGLFYRINVRALAYLSLPVVVEKTEAQLSSNDLAYKYRVTSNEKYLTAFLNRVKKDIVGIVNIEFERQIPIYGTELLVATGLEGAEESFHKYDFFRETKIESFMQKRVKGNISDFMRNEDYLSRLARNVHGRIKELLESAEKEGTEINLEQLYEMIPDASEKTINLAYDIVVGSKKKVSLQTIIGDDDRKTISLQELTENKHPSIIIDQAEILGNKEIIEILLERLLPHEKEIIVRYFLEERTMKEVGGAVGLSESRVSQIMPNIIRRMRVEAAKYEF